MVDLPVPMNPTSARLWMMRSVFTAGHSTRNRPSRHAVFSNPMTPMPFWPSADRKKCDNSED